jgi:hypothetical protein
MTLINTSGTNQHLSYTFDTTRVNRNPQDYTAMPDEFMFVCYTLLPKDVTSAPTVTSLLAQTIANYFYVE